MEFNGKALDLYLVSIASSIVSVSAKYFLATWHSFHSVIIMIQQIKVRLWDACLVTAATQPESKQNNILITSIR